LLLVGLTGGLGSGKSEALAACERLGAPTLSSDAVVHELLGAPEVRDLLRERWGEGVVSGGDVDRDAVASIVFDSPDELSWLEGSLFPRVGRRIAAWRSDLERADPPPDMGIVEVPLLFEAGVEGLFDATIAVVADEAVRAGRAAARGHAAVEGRTGRQLSQEEKAARADYVVHNDGTLQDLEVAMAVILEKLRERAR
jgi:dephospho-CoA kinase